MLFQLQYLLLYLFCNWYPKNVTAAAFYEGSLKVSPANIITYHPDNHIWKATKAAASLAMLLTPSLLCYYLFEKKKKRRRKRNYGHFHHSPPGPLLLLCCFTYISPSYYNYYRERSIEGYGLFEARHFWHKMAR
jgi:hypothetical protein